MHRYGVAAATAWGLLACVAAFAGTPGAASYTYDNLGRLRSVQYDDANVQTYTYDDAGNRKKTTPDGVASVTVPTTLTVNEGATASLTVTRSGYMPSAFSLDVQVTDVTAVAGVNYTTPAATVSFTGGQATASVTIPTIRDNKYNTAVQLKVLLLNNNPLVVLRQRGSTVTINNVDPAPSFSISGTASLVEGDTGTYTVTKTNGSALTHTVKIQAVLPANNPALPGDYTFTTQTLTFLPADTAKSVTAATTNDQTYGGSRVFQMKIKTPTNGAVIGTATRDTTINENDPAPSLSINSVASIENSLMTFTITKTGSTRLSHQVTYTANSGTATLGTDFLAPTGSPVTFISADTAKLVLVTSLDDALNESNETFTVTLSSPTNGAVLGTAVGTGTINENSSIPPEIPGGFNPVNITATQGTAYTISWGAANGKVTKYELYKNSVLVYPGPGTSTSCSTGNVNTCGNSGLGVQGHYDLSVRACNGPLCGLYTYGTADVSGQ